MKTTATRLTRTIYTLLLVFILGAEAAHAQDSFTSVKINLRNITMTPDRKTISYDIYFQDIDASVPVAVPGFIFRLTVPQEELGTNAKVVTVTNASPELGATTPTMSVSGTNWLMKFLNSVFVQSYKSALMCSETFPGSLIATFNISNEDGTPFNNPQTFSPAYSGTGPLVKPTISIFKPDSTVLAPNSTPALPATSFNGFGFYTMTINSGSCITNLPKPTNVDKKIKDVTVYDLNGKIVLTQRIKEGSTINTVKLPKGVYLVDENGTKTKLIKN